MFGTHDGEKSSKDKVYERYETRRKLGERERKRVINQSHDKKVTSATTKEATVSEYVAYMSAFMSYAKIRTEKKSPCSGSGREQ